MKAIPIDTEAIYLPDLGTCTVEDIRVTIERPDGGRFVVTGTMLAQMMSDEVSWLVGIDGYPVRPSPNIALLCWYGAMATRSSRVCDCLISD